MYNATQADEEQISSLKWHHPLPLLIRSASLLVPHMATMRQKVGIVLCLLVVAILGLAISGVGIYLFIRHDAKYDKTMTAMITNKRFIGDCIYEYTFNLNNITYRGSYVTNDLCSTRDFVDIKYDSSNPARNSATIFGSFPPRKLEGLEIAGCVLISIGGTFFIIAVLVECFVVCSWQKQDPSTVKPISNQAAIA